MRTVMAEGRDRTDMQGGESSVEHMWSPVIITTALVANKN